MPARRLVTVAAATALAAGPAVLAGAGTAHATEEQGRASAAVLRTGLDVALLNKTVHLPLAVTLNEVQAPESARQTALTAKLDGVDGGKPFNVLRADVADAKATVTGAKAEGYTNLVRARVHVPGLPRLAVVEVEQVTSQATCEAGEKPVASSNLLGSVRVLGKKVTLTAGGTTQVKVPGVGEVRLDLSRTETTSRTAAATALELKVAVNPLDLNVAEVDGTVTLAKATCETPAAPAPAEKEPEAAESAPATAPADEDKPADKPAEKPGEKPADEAVADVKPQGAPAATADLAATGGNSATPYIAGGACALVLAGGGAVYLARRRHG